MAESESTKRFQELLNKIKPTDEKTMNRLMYLANTIGGDELEEEMQLLKDFEEYNEPGRSMERRSRSR